MKPVSQNEIDKINKFLLDNPPEVEQDDDITMKKATEVWNCKRSSAEIQLTKLVEEGKLVTLSGIMLSNGRRGRIWRQVKK